jgi:hypothetical protein
MTDLRCDELTIEREESRMQSIRRVRRELQSSRGTSNGHAALPIHGSIERDYWRIHYNERDYVEPSYGFRAYEPAFRYGWEFRAGYGERGWREAEAILAAGWERFKGDCPLPWEKAAPAVHDAYTRSAEPMARRMAA